ncbi:MAG: DUF4202 domain-containing protein [Deltaproteobacteria bacterium]|nr:DUF4202 domain-containing protein [Deltaproteobacteria bacterium]
MNHSPLLQQALKRFDEANSQDPKKIIWQNQSYPHELLYSKWLTQWVYKLEPNPSELLLLASRCQHLCRWEIPRESYPEGKVGYLQWRKRLYAFHAKKAESVLKEIGYDNATIEKVSAILLKKDLKDPDTQCIEDALCLVFLEYQFREFMKKTPAEKMPGILQKTWKKMSEKAHQFALQLPFSKEELTLIETSLRG